MKYSLKNKEFNKKRLAIFDNNNKRSRSKSTSRTPRKSLNNQTNLDRSFSNKNNLNQQKLNVSADDRLESHQLQGSSMFFRPQNDKFTVSRNQEKNQLFQSFANKSMTGNIQNNRRLQIKNQQLTPCQPLKILNMQGIKLQKVSKRQNQSANKNQSFQVCQQFSQNPSRINRFMTQVLFQRQKSESPRSKVVFQPVIRKSMTPSPVKSISPNPINLQHSQISHQYNINFQNKPFIQAHSQSPPPVRKVVFQQKPRQVIYNQSQIIQHKPVQNRSISVNNNQQIKKIVHQQVKYLKQKLQQQALQIQYLKNQKQILQSNIQLRYTPKKPGYYQKPQIFHSSAGKSQRQYIQSESSQNSQFLNQRVMTPQKYGKVYIPLTNHTNQNNEILDRNKILQICQILDKNRLRINFIQNKFVTICQKLVRKYNETINSCQQKLIQKFTIKYVQFSHDLTNKIHSIQQKYNKIQNLDSKLQVFANTFRNISQNIRITKLKQQNIQLMIENEHKKTDRYWKQQPSKLTLLNRSDISSIRRYEDNQLEQKDREDLYKLSRNINNKKKLENISIINSNAAHNNITANHNNITTAQNKPSQFQQLLDQKYSHLIYNRKKQSQMKQVSNKFKQQPHKSRQNRQKHYRKSNSPIRSQLVYSKIYTQNDTNSRNKSFNEEIQHYSPFQANQMFKKQKNQPFQQQSRINRNQDNINQKQSQMNLSFGQTSSQVYDFSKNSFDIDFQFQQKSPNQQTKQTNPFKRSSKSNHHQHHQIRKQPEFPVFTRTQQQKDISFNSKTAFQKQNTQTGSQKSLIQDTLQGQQQRLIRILSTRNYNFPLECWLDQLGCLRKKNQTYLFDQQGSVIMTTKPAFKKLKQRKFFI